MMVSLIAWQFEPGVWLSAALSLGCYGWLYRRSAADRGRAPWPAWQAASFGIGVIVILLALESPLDALADGLFWAHMAQHMLLLAVAPPLLVLGLPARAVLRAIPRSARRSIVRPLARSRSFHRAGSLLFHPLTVLLTFNGSLIFWHLPPIYTAATTQPALHVLEHASYLLSGLLLWWLIVEPLRVWPKDADLSKIVFVIVAHLPMLLLGQVFLAFASLPLYGRQTAAETAWGLTALTDQRLGGAMMVSLDMLITFGVVSVLFGRYLARLERRQRWREQAGDFSS